VVTVSVTVPEAEPIWLAMVPAVARPPPIEPLMMVESVTGLFSALQVSAPRGTMVGLSTWGSASLQRATQLWQSFRPLVPPLTLRRTAGVPFL
jgi:hypothetical protein